MAQRRKLTVDQYAALLLDMIDAPLSAETVPRDQAQGRTLAVDQTAQMAIPPFMNSAMDGFAVRYDDLGGYSRGKAPLPIVGAVYAGDAPLPLSPGTAARIMTGAPLPTGADTVVPLEDCAETADAVGFTSPVVAGQHVRYAGEDRQPGDLVLQQGTALAARHLAAAAAAGLTQLPVVRRPRLGIVVTGSEVVAAGGPVGVGQLPDSNGPFLATAAIQAGGDPTLAHCPDDGVLLDSLLDGTASSADLIVITGGASVGDRDTARDVLSQAGGQFLHVAMQPGKPQGHGTWRGTPIVALPGNPVSVAVSWAVFVRPLIDALLGRPPAPTRWCVAEEPWPSPAGRRQFMPVKLSYDTAGRTLARPAGAGGSASHFVGSLALADAFAVVPEDARQVRVGDALQLADLA